MVILKFQTQCSIYCKHSSISMMCVYFVCLRVCVLDKRLE